MTPENLLRSMCERHGLPPEYGVRLLPLVQRALTAPDEVRERILALVDGNLAQVALKGPSAVPDLDLDVLIAVARVLHDWAPSGPMLDLGASFGGVDANGPDDR